MLHVGAEGNTRSALAAFRGWCFHLHSRASLDSSKDRRIAAIRISERDKPLSGAQ